MDYGQFISIFIILFDKYSVKVVCIVYYTATSIVYSFLVCNSHALAM